METPVLMFMNMKGGVGKTTLAVEISRMLAHDYHKRVLLIDYDPQSNASLAFLEPAKYFLLLDEGKSVAHCLMPSFQANDPFSVVRANSSASVDHREFKVTVRRWRYARGTKAEAGRLDLILGSLDLMRLALNAHSAETEKRLLSRWNGLVQSAKGDYDCVVIDCHPAGSFFTKSALLSSIVAVVPVTSDAYAATGLNMMRSHMAMWQPSGGAKDFLVIFNDAHNAWDTLVESAIRGNVRFADHCLSNRINYSRLFRNLAKRRKTSIEQPVAYRRQVGENVRSVTKEMVEQLRDRKILDSSWR